VNRTHTPHNVFVGRTAGVDRIQKVFPRDRGKPVATENSKRYEMTSVRFADK
jgi:hypothetical protein